MPTKKSKPEDVIIPYDPQILERMQRQLDAARLTPEQRQAKAEWLKDLDDVDVQLGLKEGPPPSTPLFSANSGKLFLKKWLVLSQGEKDVLRLLVSQGSATLKEMRNVHSSPHKVLKTLCKKYPALEKHITFPGGPGRGGYSTTIKWVE